MNPFDFDPDILMDAARHLWRYFNSGEFRNDFWLGEKVAKVALWLYQRLVFAATAATELEATTILRLVSEATLSTEASTGDLNASLKPYPAGGK